MIDWVTRNKEWLFNGAGVVLLSSIAALIIRGRMRARNRTRIKQLQGSGNDSTNIQAAGDIRGVTIVSGTSYSEIRAIAKDVFESNFYKLSAIAAQTAKQRANELLDSYLAKLSEQTPSALKS